MTRLLRCCPALLGMALLLSSCASPVPGLADRQAKAMRLAAASGWQAQTLRAGPFTLETFEPATIAPFDQLTVYIEGDGLAWLAPDRLSDDPTPLDPLALELALAQPRGNRVYLARPCQYTGGATGCPSRYWSQERFSETVIDSMNMAVSQLKARFGATRLTLVGYSGGGAVAALLAARRNDVSLLVTVAGNLSVQRWTNEQALSPLKGSLDPYDERKNLQTVVQWHFVGNNDAVVPLKLTEEFAIGLPLAHIVPVEGFDHRCCWAEQWPALWARLPH